MVWGSGEVWNHGMLLIYNLITSVSRNKVEFLFKSSYLSLKTSNNLNSWLLYYSCSPIWYEQCFSGSVLIKGMSGGYTELYNKQMLKVTPHVLPLWIWAWNILHGFGNLITGGNENVFLKRKKKKNFRKIHVLKGNIWKKILTKGYFSLGQKS